MDVEKSKRFFRNILILGKAKILFNYLNNSTVKLKKVKLKLIIIFVKLINNNLL